MQHLACEVSPDTFAQYNDGNSVVVLKLSDNEENDEEQVVHNGDQHNNSSMHITLRDTPHDKVKQKTVHFNKDDYSPFVKLEQFENTPHGKAKIINQQQDADLSFLSPIKIGT